MRKVILQGLILVVLVGICVGSLALGAECEPGGEGYVGSWQTSCHCSYCQSTVDGVYSTAAEAVAARDAEKPAGATSVNGWVSGYAFDGAKWGAYAYWVCNYGLCPPNCVEIWHVFLYPQAGYACVGYVDDDGDGIPDRYDPYPGDDTAFKWRIKSGVKDDSGVWRSAVIETDRGDTFFYEDSAWMAQYNEGEVSGKSVVNICRGDDCYTLDSSTMAAAFGDGIAGNADRSSGAYAEVEYSDGERVVTAKSGVSAGQSPGESDTDSQLLNKVASNTAASANNDQVISDQLKGIAQGIEGVRDAVEKVGSKVGAGAAGGSADSVAEGTGTAMGERAEAEEAEALSESSEEIAGIGSSEFSESGEYDVGDVPEKNLLADLIDGFLGNNAVSAALENSGVQTAGGYCSVNVNWTFGGVERTYTLSICQYEEMLETWGTIVLAMAGLMSLLVIVRR